MIRRMIILVAAVAAVSAPLCAGPAAAQEVKKAWRIGFITPGTATSFQPRLAALRQGLRKLGYAEGKNIVIVERYGEGRRDKLAALAAELVGRKVDIIVSHGLQAPVVQAARSARKPIPVVVAVTANPLVGGFVASLARPGGNVTGLTDSHSDLVPKRLALLREVVPAMSRIAVLWHPGIPAIAKQLKAVQAMAPALGLEILPVELASPGDLDSALAALREAHPDALYILGYPLIGAYRQRIVKFALDQKLPTISTNMRSVRAGGLMTYGVDFLDMYRRAAAFVDKILKGANPADLPVEQPTRFYLAVNLKTARALGIAFPRSILLRADKVFE